MTATTLSFTFSQNEDFAAAIQRFRECAPLLRFLLVDSPGLRRSFSKRTILDRRSNMRCG